MKVVTRTKWQKSLTLISILMIGFIAISPQIASAEPDTKVAEAEKKLAEKRRETNEALTTLSSLLTQKAEQQKTIADLKSQLTTAQEDVTKKEIEENLKVETANLDKLNEQITALSTGVTEESYFERDAKEFNLQEELQGLAEPFVKMIKSATQSARQIDTLRTIIDEAKRKKSMAQAAIDRLETLVQFEQEAGVKTPTTTNGHLDEQITLWRKRIEEASNSQTTSEQQLALTLKKEREETISIDTYATGFIRSRGVNLLLAVGAFIITFMVLRLIGQIIGTIANKIRNHRNGQLTFYSRVIRLGYQGISIVIALMSMLLLLNYLNDWILLGITGLFMIALAWMGLKMLPAMIEQGVLLLNLGAVQEGERVMMDGVPWLVSRLDHYTDLVNPVLDGGTFTLPVRALTGMQSRPAAQDETWFPTRKDDWVHFENGVIARVISQTPELVQLVELGGARITLTTQNFIENAPRNISTGFRISVEFGIDYRHQAIATTEIPKKLEAHVENGLRQVINPRDISNIDVDILRAGPSSIDFEVEADLSGKLASRYEDIESELNRLVIEACNVNGWKIPFPQLVLHQGN